MKSGIWLQAGSDEIVINQKRDGSFPAASASDEQLLDKLAQYSKRLQAILESGLVSDASDLDRVGSAIDKFEDAVHSVGIELEAAESRGVCFPPHIIETYRSFVAMADKYKGLLAQAKRKPH